MVLEVFLWQKVVLYQDQQLPYWRISWCKIKPEVVAPLSKLKSMIDGGAMQGEFVLRGQV